MPGPPEAFASLLRNQRGYLAARGSEGEPHIVPVSFTWAGDVIWAAVNGKPRSTPVHRQLAEIQSESRVTFLVDRWDEDWSRLAWLEARGRARQTSHAEGEKVKKALQGKYAHYASFPPEGPLIRIDVTGWFSWEA